MVSKHLDTGKMNTLKVTDLTIKINNKKLLQDISFNLNCGHNLVILGPSGIGKTTLLSVLAGLQPPSSGDISYGNQSIYAELNEAERDAFRGDNIGIVFQSFHLIKHLSVKQNILLALSGADKTIRSNAVEDMLTRLNILHLKDQKAENLSVGEAQRVATARALITNPKWLFCDEPTSALDDANTESMLNLLLEASNTNKSSLIIITHDKRVINKVPSKVIQLGE